MTKTKFDLRKLAMQIVPFSSKEEAVDKIKKKVAELRMNDHEIIEFIKQANVASQYKAYKDNNFKLNTEINAVTVVPAHVFNEISKVNLKKTAAKAPTFFTNLKKVISSDYSVKKTASLKVFEKIEKPDLSKSLMELVKIASVNDRALKAVKDIESYAVNNLKYKKGEFIALSKKFEDYIRMFPSLKSKYASLLDDNGVMGTSIRTPSARDIVEIKTLQEKIGSVVLEISKLNNILDIVKSTSRH
jgi:hypothetical protein